MRTPFLQCRTNEYERAEAKLLLMNVPSDITQHDTSSRNYYDWRPFFRVSQRGSNPADFSQGLAQRRTLIRSTSQGTW
jgi:hypothetical protein